MPTPASAAAPPARAWVLPEEPLPVRLMGTIHADTDGIHDELRTPADVDEWLDAVGIDRAGAPATGGELARARALRDAVRRLAAHVTQDSRLAAVSARGASATGDVAAALDQVNSAAAELPAPLLTLRDGRLELGVRRGASPVTTGLARVAEQAAALLGGQDADRLRACYAPGCVLYFIKTHPRREWCSVACGNRVRAARHYQRVRRQQGDA
jgi:predicted RNA-binding Zn ribbon-like protein